jgi:hypothetical protein
LQPQLPLTHQQVKDLLLVALKAFSVAAEPIGQARELGTLLATPGPPPALRVAPSKVGDTSLAHPRQLPSIFSGGFGVVNFSP